MVNGTTNGRARRTPIAAFLTAILVGATASAQPPALGPTSGVAAQPAVWPKIGRAHV